MDDNGNKQWTAQGKFSAAIQLRVGRNLGEVISLSNLTVIVEMKM